MKEKTTPIPQFDKNRNLPPGIYKVTLDDIEDQLTWNEKRKELFTGLSLAISNLKSANVKRVWIDGSFVTNKDEPNDIDGCWEYDLGVDDHKLDVVFLDMSPPRKKMKDKYGVDFLISGAPLMDAAGKTVEDFFQEDRDGNLKGILLLEV